MAVDWAARFRWELHEVRQALGGWRLYRTLAVTAVGVTIFSIGINGLAIPHQLFAPGMTGIALFWFYLLGWPSVGVVYLFLNLPLFLLGWREYALKHVLLTLVGVGMFTLAMALTGDVRIPVSDTLMAAMLAGVLTGSGSGMYLRFGGSAGGLDILGAYLKKKFSIPIGTLFITLNGLNLVGALFARDLETALFSAIFMGANSWMVEKVQSGFSQRNAVLIISSKPFQVAEEVIQRLNRGVTFLEGSGGFGQQPEKVVFTVIHMFELGKLKEMLFEVDPEAFVVVHNTSEVIGGAFLTWEDQGFRRRPWNAPRRRATDPPPPPVEVPRRRADDPPRSEAAGD